MLMDSGCQSYQQVDLDAQAFNSPHQLVIMLIDGLPMTERVSRLAEGAGINRCMNILA